MVNCSSCGKEISDKTALKATIGRKQHYFCDESCFWRSNPTKSITGFFSGVVLNKFFAELVALGTGIGGVVYTLTGTAERALVLDTFSVIAAITAMVIGIEHLRYLKEHDLLRRAVLLLTIVILISIAIVVWHFGFRLNNA